MNATTEILQGTIDELEEREATLTEEIERVQQSAKVELRDVRRALTGLRKQVPADSNGSNGASAPRVDEAPPGPVDPATKDAVMRELEARRQSGAAGARAAGIAEVANLQQGVVKRALEELQESRDVETYGKGLWRIAE